MSMTDANEFGIFWPCIYESCSDVNLKTRGVHGCPLRPSTHAHALSHSLVSRNFPGQFCPSVLGSRFSAIFS